MKEKKKKSKVVWIVGIVIFLLIGMCALGSSNDKSSTEKKDVHLYDEEYTQVLDLMNGFGDEKVGKYSLTKYAEADLTDELLVDFYNNYVTKSDCNYCVVLFTDSSDGKGIYFNSFVQQCHFEKDATGAYMMTDDIDYYYVFEGDSVKKGSWDEVH